MKTHITVVAYIIYENKVLLAHHKKYDLWLPPGGHIEENEDFEQALLREIKEEISIDIEILNQSDIPVVGDTVRNIPAPFYSNVHKVLDHQHCCLYYLCKAKTNNVKLNDELLDFAWFSKEDLNQEHIPPDVRAIAEKALEIYHSLKSQI